MLRGLFERQQEELTNELAPYANMAADLEVEQRLQGINDELILANRALLNSNDRYQTSACYLSMARNRHLLMTSITNHIVSQQGANEIRDNKDEVLQFVVRGYEGVRDTLVAADTVGAQTGYTLSQHDSIQLQDGQRLQWLPAQRAPRPYVVGTVEAVDAVLAHVMAQHSTNIKSSQIMNDFKMRLRQQADPLFAQVEAKQKAIERITGGLLGTVKSESALASIYEYARDAMTILDKLTILTTMPRIVDPLFTLKDQLDEANPNKKSFDPSIIATPVVRQQIAPAPRPIPAGKPFSSDVLRAPEVPKPAAPTSPPRPFTPDSLLNTPNPVTAPSPRPFKADILSSPSLPTKEGTASPRPFTADILGAKATEKTFNPEDLDK